MLILSPIIMLYMYATQKWISYHTVTKFDGNLMQTKLIDDKPILKVDGECLISAARQQKAKDTH